MRFLLEGKGGEVQKVHFLGPKGPLFWGCRTPPPNRSWLRACSVVYCCTFSFVSGHTVWFFFLLFFIVHCNSALGPRFCANKIISYHIISYHIISYHIISYHIISYHIISYHTYHIISYHIISYHNSCSETL